jgi:hypothetical protein
VVDGDGLHFGVVVREVNDELRNPGRQSPQDMRVIVQPGVRLDRRSGGAGNFRPENTKNSSSVG